ncbi:MAG: Gfo/Idh/MocA family oxidoreductase [Spirochaetota bacterium]
MKPVKWGIIGAAEIFKKVVRGMQKSTAMKIQGLASRNREKAGNFAQKYGIPTWYGTYEELLKDPEVEAVYIPLPNHLHGEWIKKSADAGKHILCEKPLCMDASEARQCIDYAHKRGVLIMEAFMYRFHPQWKKVAELLRVDEIGAIQSVNTVFGYYNVDPANIRNKLETGGGALRDIGCYAVSTARYILNREPDKVLSLLRRDQCFKTDILTAGILDFGNAHTVFTVATQTYPCQRVDIHGTSGTISIDIPFNVFPDIPAVVRVRNALKPREIHIDPADQYGEEFEAFSLAIRHGLKEPTSPEDAVQNQKVLDALFASEKSGCWEKV